MAVVDSRTGKRLVRGRLGRWILGMVVVGLVWITTEGVLHWRVVPPGSVRTLAAFREWRPATGEFRSVTVKGTEYLIAYGGMGGLLPSGPAAYVFDAQGKLVDWSADIGDDGAFDGRWDAQRSFGVARRINATQAATWAAHPAP